MASILPAGHCYFQNKCCENINAAIFCVCVHVCVRTCVRVCVCVSNAFLKWTKHCSDGLMFKSDIL